MNKLIKHNNNRRRLLILAGALCAVACKGKTTGTVQGEASPAEVQTTQTEPVVYDHNTNLYFYQMLFLQQQYTFLY